MKKGILVAMAVAGIVALAAANVSANLPNLVVNGGFEEPVVIANYCGYPYYGPDWMLCDSSQAPGWTVEWYGDESSASTMEPVLELQRDGAMGVWPNEGAQKAELDTHNEITKANVKIYQDLATCPGADYTVQYAWHNRTIADVMEVWWDGVLKVSHPAPSGGWASPTWTWTASGGTTRIAFAEAGPADTLGIFLDSVSVTGPTHPCEVAIDIKPGSDPNCFNNDGHGVIPVAILGSADFDVMSIDPGTVQLEGLAVRKVGKSDKLLAHIEDVNGDTFDDLVVQIEDVDGIWTAGTTLATLTGALYDGTPIVGQDYVCITQ